ncbi:hypothetical protein Tco_0998365 [Tanacetum coccineum]
MFWHTARDIYQCFTSMRCISRHEDTQVYGTILPKELINQAMLESNAYKTYYAFASGEKAPKPNRTNLIWRTKRSKKDFTVSHKRSWVLDITTYESESEKESWGDSEDGDDNDDDGNNDDDGDSDDDNDEGDDKMTEFDRDKIPGPKKTNEEHNEEEEEEYDDEFNIEEEEKIDDEETMDEEDDDEVTKELYDDVNVNLQVEEDAHVTLTPVISTQKADKPIQSSSVSSDFISKLLILRIHLQILPQAVSDFATPVIEKNVTESVEVAVLTRSSSQPMSTYEAVASLSEFELTKILMDKMEKNKGLEMIVTKIETHPLDQTEGRKEGTQVKMLSPPEIQDELHKFSNGPLEDVRSALNDNAKGIRMEYLPMRRWSNLDKKKARVMIQDIDKYEKRSKSENKGIVPTEMELLLEQTQQGTSHEVSVSAEGVEELKRKVKINGEKKEALLTLKQKPVIMEYLVNIKRRAFWSLNEDILKITILTTNVSYPSRKIQRIRACTHERPQKKLDQYVVSREDQYAVLEI